MQTTNSFQQNHNEVYDQLKSGVRPIQPLVNEAGIPLEQLMADQAKLIAELEIDYSSVDTLVGTVNTLTFFTPELGQKGHVMNAIGREDTLAVARLNKELNLVNQFLSIQKYLSLKNEWDKRWLHRTLTNPERADEWGNIPKVGQYIPAEKWSIVLDAFNQLFTLTQDNHVTASSSGGESI